MNENSILQFICFSTKLQFSDFAAKWEVYAQKIKKETRSDISLKEFTGPKSKFRYISTHLSPSGEFRYNLVKGRESEHFPDHDVRVTYAGGYLPIHTDRVPNVDEYTRVMVFVTQADRDINFYSSIPLYSYHTIYQAYFESCLYSHIIDYYLKEQDVADFLLLLKDHPHCEEAEFRVCEVFA